MITCQETKRDESPRVDRSEGNPDLKAIGAIVKGSGKNVFKDITQYFVNAKANASDADNLAGRVASFLVQVRKDAGKITKTVKIIN